MLWHVRHFAERFAINSHFNVDPLTLEHAFLSKLVHFSSTLVVVLIVHPKRHAAIVFRSIAQASLVQT
eukprot:3580199-Rhodomonas_salina.2